MYMIIGDLKPEDKDRITRMFEDARISGNAPEPSDSQTIYFTSLGDVRLALDEAQAAIDKAKNVLYEYCKDQNELPPF